MTSERERFEAYIQRVMPARSRSTDVDRQHYDAIKEHLWSGWQARAALPAPADQPTSQEAREPDYRKLWLRACKAYDEKNPSGCVCNIDPGTDEIRSPCAMHKHWLDAAVDADRKARQQEALDAQRYRWLRALTTAGNGFPRQEFKLPNVPKRKGTDLLRGSVAQHLDTAIDAAIAKGERQP